VPSRYLRDGILDSRRMGRVSEGAQLLYYKLLSLVDDYGRYEADPELLIIKCFPWSQASYTPEVLRRRLHELNGEGNEGHRSSEPLIHIYEANGKQYLEVIDNQRTPRAMRSKYPSPSEPEGSLGIPKDPVGIVETSPLSNTNTNTNTKYLEKESEEKPLAEVLRVPPRKPKPLLTEQQVEWFEKFWKVYWRKDAKREAVKAFAKQVTTEEQFCCVMEAIKAQTPQRMDGPRRFIPLPSTWINGQRWEDEIETEEKNLCMTNGAVGPVTPAAPGPVAHLK
jgi:hypothetical protein